MGLLDGGIVGDFDFSYCMFSHISRFFFYIVNSHYFNQEKLFKINLTLRDAKLKL